MQRRRRWRLGLHQLLATAPASETKTGAPRHRADRATHAVTRHRLHGDSDEPSQFPISAEYIPQSRGWQEEDRRTFSPQRMWASHSWTVSHFSPPMSVSTPPPPSPRRLRNGPNSPTTTASPNAPSLRRTAAARKRRVERRSATQRRPSHRTFPLIN